MEPRISQKSMKFTSFRDIANELQGPLVRFELSVPNPLSVQKL